jgi:hypothetical protein
VDDSAKNSQAPQQHVIRLDSTRSTEDIVEELGGEDSVHAKMFVLSRLAPMRQAWAEIEATAGYELLPRASHVFVEYATYRGAGGRVAPPTFVVAAESDDKWSRWYRQHAQSLEDAQNALCAAYYHRDVIFAIESRISEIVAQTGVRDLMPAGSTTAGGNTRRLDFEYHGFLTASRRCLDYMTRSIAAFFRNEQTSFRRFEAGLKTKAEELLPVAEQTRAAYARHANKFPDLLSAGNMSTSLRDRLTHLEHLPAGVLNLTARGVFICGGAEELSPITESSALLTTVLDAKLSRLQHCVDDVVRSFDDALRTALSPKLT